MDISNLNFIAVGKAFMTLLTTEYGDNDEPPNEYHQAVADYLLERLEKLHEECVAIDENENTIEELDPAETEDREDKENKSHVPLEIKRKAVKFNEDHPNYSFKTIKHNFPLLLYPPYLDRWKNDVIQGGSRRELMKIIEEGTFETFKDVRNDFAIIHDSDIKTFALQKATEFPLFKFKACQTWLSEWKKKYRISSRKVQKLISNRAMRSQDQIIQMASDFRESFKSAAANYDKSLIWNSDQTSFNLEMLSQRTLSFTGEKRTFGMAFSPKNKATHSYTVQYLISMQGTIVGDAYVCLQEVNGKIGDRVLQNVLYAPNLTVTCSKSGKLTKSHVEYFLDKVVKPHVKGNVLYTIDHWTGQTDETMYSSRFVGENEGFKLMLIPEQTTDLCQPLDMFFHRQLKFLVRKFYCHSKIFNADDYEYLTSRNGILQVQSLAHFLLSSPKFRGMISYSWFQAGLTTEKPDFLTVNQVCFDSINHKCSKNQCLEVTFIKCSHCDLSFCHQHFFRDYHMMECENGGYNNKQ